MNSGYTLKGELTALPDGLDMGYGKKVRIAHRPRVLPL